MKNLIKPVFRISPPKIFYSKTISPVETIPLPETTIVPVPDRADSEICINPGDSVKTGQRIGLKCNIPVFSTITGIVTDISELEWHDNETYNFITIRRQDKEDREFLFDITDDPASLETGDLLSRLAIAGYPTEIFKDKTNTIIVNCCEQDILLSGLQATIIEKTDLLKTGIILAGKISGSERIILAVQSGFDSHLQNIANAEIIPLKPVYPWCSGDLLPCYLKIQEPAVVIDAELLINMAETLTSGLPQLEKVITLVGLGNIPKKNIKVRIGTPVAAILKHENIQPDTYNKVILGGAMRGEPVYYENTPVQAGTNGIIIQDINDVTEISTESCLNCGLCVQICPQKLQVNLLARYSEYSFFERCEELNIWDCIECGMCAYVCVSHRPLVQFLQFAKKELLKHQETAREESSNDE